MRQRRTVRVPPSLVVPVVGDGAVAGRSVMEGRLVPLLILDTSARPEIAEMIRVHGVLQTPGDAETQWSTLKHDVDTVALHLAWKSPVELQMVIPFSIERQAILVECVLRSRGVYLQAGAKGDVPSSTMSSPRVLVEVPDTGFGEAWSDILLSRMTSVMARETGRSKRSARPLAVKLVEDIRRLADLRLA